MVFSRKEEKITAFKIGFIGAAGIAQWHMKRISTTPDAKMTAIRDLAAAKPHETTEIRFLGRLRQ